MDTADQTTRAGCRASTAIFLWLCWRDNPPVQSDQLSPIGADKTSATSLSHSTYNLLLYGQRTEKSGFYINMHLCVLVYMYSMYSTYI